MAHLIGLNGVSDHYSIERKGRPLTLGFYMALEDGDTIVVKAPDDVLRIRYVDQTVEDITAAKSPYHVAGRKSTPEPTSNFLNALWHDVLRSGDFELRSTAVRGGDDSPVPLPLSLEIPGLADGSARVDAGDRHFALRWIGGIAPFRVTLLDAGKNSVVDERQIFGHSLIIQSHAIHITNGTYYIVVGDSSGNAVKGSFRAVAGSAPPQNQSAEDVTHAAAQEMARGGKPRAFEAFLQLQPAAFDKWQPAVELADWIGHGEPHR